MTAVNVRGPVDRAASAAARQQWLETLFRAAKGLLTVRCEGTDLYRLCVALDDSNWWGVDLLQVTSTPGGYALHQMDALYGAAPLLSLPDGDASISRSGAGWSSSTANADAYNGAYRQTSTTSDYVEFTSPASTVKIGVRGVFTSNAGICKVAVNGDATAANLLPTAQDLVNQGTLASSALVANGGTLSPTDRVLDQYRSSTSLRRFDTVIGVVDGLTAGVHTVRLTNMGYKRTAASDDRLYFSGFTYATLATTISTGGAEILPMEYLNGIDFGSAFEFAHEVLPSSGSYTFVGNVHGYESQDSLSVYADGALRAMSAGDDLQASVVEVVRVSHLRHPDYGGGASNLADVTTVYRVSADGLEVSTKTAWLASATVRTSYPAMQPLSARTFTRASAVGSDVTTDYSLTAHDGSFLLKKRGTAGYVWQPSGNWAALLTIKDRATVNDWAASAPDYWMVQDRDYKTVKQYVPRVAGSLTESVTNGAVWRSSARHALQRFANPEVVLAR